MPRIDTQQVGNYIKIHDLGKINQIRRGGVYVRASISAIEFVNKRNHMTLDSKLRLICEELALQPDRTGYLESLLKSLGIDYTTHDIKELEKEFARTGFITVIEECKDYIRVFLTPKGLDFLHSPTKPHQPSIVFNNYHNSVIAEGNNITQSGSFELGIKNSSIGNKNNSQAHIELVGIVERIITTLQRDQEINENLRRESLLLFAELLEQVRKEDIQKETAAKVLSIGDKISSVGSFLLSLVPRLTEVVAR